MSNVDSPGPPQLPALVKGQELKSGPYTVRVTDEMVAQRERENAELRRAWLSAQQSGIARNSENHNDQAYAEKFQHSRTRRIFVRKVFCILGIQLLFTAAVIACFMFIDEAKKFMVLYWFIWIIALILFTMMYCAVSCSDCARRRVPCNYICLLLLTVAMAYLSASVSVFYSTDVVLITVGMTAATVLSVSVLATFSKFDLTMRTGLLTILALLTIFAIILMSIFFIFTQLRLLSLLIAVLAALLMSMYLYFDIQTIMGGRRVEISPDEVVYATTQIYVDIMLLYQYLLMCFGFIHD